MQKTISIHSLVKRETLHVWQKVFFRIHFNPLPRKEGDAMLAMWLSLRMSISIHSLVKRETGIQGNACSGFDDFNPLPRKEGDARKKSSNLWSGYFNPLPRKEGDDSIVLDGNFSGHFNPLPRKEGDPSGADWFPASGDISIHSLVKRETKERLTSTPLGQFQSTPS